MSLSKKLEHELRAVNQSIEVLRLSKELRGIERKIRTASPAGRRRLRSRPTKRPADPTTSSTRERPSSSAAFQLDALCGHCGMLGRDHHQSRRVKGADNKEAGGSSSHSEPPTGGFLRNDLDFLGFSHKGGTGDSRKKKLVPVRRVPCTRFTAGMLGPSPHRSSIAALRGGNTSLPRARAIQPKPHDPKCNFSSVFAQQGPCAKDCLFGCAI